MRDCNARDLRFLGLLKYSGVFFSLAWLLLPRPVSAQEDPVVKGISWLRLHQHTDGSWGDEDRLSVRDTAEIVSALQSVAQDDPTLQCGLDWLMSQIPLGVDLAARRLAVLRGQLSETILDLPLRDLASAKTLDGGWGSNLGFGNSDALDTALALRALVETSALSSEALYTAVTRVIALQNPDGGFAYASGEASDLKTSAEVLLALGAVSRVASVDSVTSSVADFLLEQQAADGGFPLMPAGTESDVRTTALVTRALASSGANIMTQYPVMRSFLMEKQLANGSWDESPYTTALALGALGGVLPDLMIANLELIPTTIPRGADATLKITIANLGLVASKWANISIYVDDPRAGGVLAKSIPVEPIAEGGVKTTTTTISTQSTLATMVSSVAYFIVVDAEDKVNEGCETNNRKSVVLDLVGMQPPQFNHGPIISSKPPVRAVVGTVYTYQIVATDPEGDLIWYNSLYGPPGMHIDMDTGLFTWAVNVPAGTRVVAEIGALDPGYAGDAQGWSIDVVEPGTKWPPTIDSYPSSTAVEGTPYVYALEGTDPDGGPLMFTLLTGPSGMTLNPATHVISWTPTASDTGEKIVRISVTDAEGATTEQQWIIVVSPISSQKPDLLPVAIDLLQSATDPQSLHRDGAAVLTVANQGTAAAGKFSILIYEDRDGQNGYSELNDKKLGASSLDTLAVGARADVVIPLDGEVLFRDNRLAVMVDINNEVSELREDNNQDFSGNKSRFVATPGPFRASLKWEVKAEGGNSGPMYFPIPLAVAQMTDDNGDGKIGVGDIPDIVGIAAHNGSRVSVWDGKTGSLHWDEYYPALAAYRPTPGIIPTVGDANSDGSPEIYFNSQLQNIPHVVALNADGSLRWKSGPNTAPGVDPSWLFYQSSDISIADLEGDGKGEVVTATSIVENDGVTRCYFPLPSSNITVVADLDLDGTSEIVALPYVYRPDCSVLWGHPEWGGLMDINAGGISGVAVAQLDADTEPEIVWTGGDGVKVVEHNGIIKWRRNTPSGYGPGNGTYVSRPAIGDIDGDGKAEIVLNDRFAVGAYEADGTLRWIYGGFSESPRGGSPTIGDLDGDGMLEVVFNDSDSLHIIRGKDGVGLFSYINENSDFGIPVIADVDADGHLEVIVPDAHNFGTSALRVFGNKNWAPGRSLWNQPNYHITNIEDDQTLPRHEVPSWKTHNSYRAQTSTAWKSGTEPEEGVADLTASYIRVDKSACPDTVKYIARIGNGGARTVPIGVKVQFASANTTGSSVMGEVLTSRSLAPGQFEDVSVSTIGGLQPIQIVVTADPEQHISDANHANNVHTFTVNPCGQEDNQNPRFISAPSQVAEIGKDWTYFPQAVDPDGDVLSYEITSGPLGMSLLSHNSLIVWRPSQTQYGPQEVAVKVADGRGGADVQQFNVEVNAPQLTEPKQPDPAGNLLINVATDKASYGSGEPVAVSSSIENQDASGRTGTLTIEIQDAAGAVLATVLDSTTLIFIGAEKKMQDVAFNTGMLLAGTYKAVATYKEGLTQSRAEATFTILSSSALATSLAIEKQRYGANELVQIFGMMENTGVNSMLEGLVSKISVIDSAQVVLEEKSFEAMDLGPASKQLRELNFNTTLREPGEYFARFEVWQTGSLQGASEARFTIVSSTERGLALSGDIAVNPSTVMLGSTFALLGNLTNVGNDSLVGLDAYLQVLDPATAQIERNYHSTLDLTKGASTLLESVFPSLGLMPKSYIARMNVTQGGRTILEVATELVVDPGPPPLLVVTAPACGSADVIPGITLTGGVPPLVQVSYLDGQPYDGSAVTGEGIHLLEVQVTDSAQRTVTAEASFIIDRTPPVISVSGVANGVAYNIPVVPVIVATDAHLTSVQHLLNGADFISGSTIASDGSYSLQANAWDCAGNQSSTALVFAMDTVAPAIDILVSTCQEGPITPFVTVTEAHIASDERHLDGQPWDGSPIVSEGTHTLNVVVVDIAGNRTERTATFIIDNTAPAITVTGVADGSWSSVPVTPVVAIADANLTALTMELDHQVYMNETPVGMEGSHVLVVTASDCAGHDAIKSVSFNLDFTAPMLSISGIPGCTASGVSPVVSVDEPATLIATLDGLPYQEGSAITAEGAHHLIATATDRAGNASTANHDFIIDKTPPGVSIMGVQDGARYLLPVTPLVDIVDANLTISEVTLNGVPFVSGTTLSEDGAYTLTVMSNDCAGNHSNRTVAFQIQRIAGEIAHDMYYGSRALLATECNGTCGTPLLRSVLIDSAIPFEEGQSRSEWLGKLRTGRFNHVVLYKPEGSESGSALPELNEAIWMGDGLVVIRSIAEPMTSLRESLGVNLAGLLSSPASIVLSSPLQPATVLSAGAGVKLQLLSATAVGRLQSNSSTVMAALNGRGLGEALTLGWDTESSGSQLLYQSLLSASAPASGTPLLAGGTTRLRTVVHNTGFSNTEYTLVHTLAPELCTKDPLQHVLTVPGGSSKETLMTLHLPMVAGDYPISSSLYSDGRLLDQESLTFEVDLTTDTLLSKADSDLRAITLTGTEAEKRDYAVLLLGQAGQASNPLAALGLVWRAIDEVRAIQSLDITAIRVDLARLLRTVQIATGGSGDSANIEGLPCFGYAITAAAACSKRPPSLIDNAGCITINGGTYVDSYSHSAGQYGGSNKHAGDVAMRCNAKPQDANNTCWDNCSTGCISGNVSYNVNLNYGVLPEPTSVPNSTTLYVNTGQTKILDPAGTVLYYDTLAVNSGGSLTLKAGSYVVKNLYLNSGGTFNVDGRVRVWVRNAPSPNTPVSIKSGIPHDFWLIYNGTGTINNNSGSKFFGVIYAPVAKINLNYEVFGAVVAGGLTLNSGGKVHYDTDLSCPSVEEGAYLDCRTDPGAQF